MYIIIVLSAISCTKEDKMSTVKQSAINKKYYVKECTARYIAENFNFFIVPKSNSRITNNLTIKDITSINDSNNIPAYYIINYNDNAGYLILSADFRQEAVLGFGEQGEALLTNIPPQLNFIIEEQTSEIEYLRENEVDSIETVPNDSWSMLPLPPDDIPQIVDPINGNCGSSYEVTKGPLLATSWGQTRGGFIPYNYLCPTPSGCMDKAPTGCVATAMAQIMYYHKWPSSYIWTQMQTGDNSTVECAKLMRDVGMSVNMSYGCSSSGAYSSIVEAALEYHFGYASSTNYETYYSGPMQVEIDGYRPIFLSAGGHAWVCDGYRYFFSGCSGSIWPHMNWGWNGFYDNYYGFNNWNPGGMTYNNNRKMIKVRKS